jgi:hypothetical protein
VHESHIPNPTKLLSEIPNKERRGTFFAFICEIRLLLARQYRTHTTGSSTDHDLQDNTATVLCVAATEPSELHFFVNRSAHSCEKTGTLRGPQSTAECGGVWVCIKTCCYLLEPARGDVNHTGFVPQPFRLDKLRARLARL